MAAILKKTMNILKFRSRQTDCQARHISDFSGKQCRPDQTNKNPSPFAIVSAYFEPYLYMLKINCLITAIFHVREHQTLDHKVVGLILTSGVMLCP